MDDLTWPTEDYVAIAEQQNDDEDRLARRGGPVLVCEASVTASTFGPG